MTNLIGSFMIILMLGVVACAIPGAWPADVSSLASQYGLSEEDLSPYLDGYERGYQDGLELNVGVRAGTQFGDLPGLAGQGWQLGVRDAVDGRPMQDPDELAQRLAR